MLVVGASGGVATFGIRIAKAMGAHVTGVTSTANTALARELGADEVVDFTGDDFTRHTGTYDLVVDNIENRTRMPQTSSISRDSSSPATSGR